MAPLIGAPDRTEAKAETAAGGKVMRTAKVTREFRDRARKLAKETTMPEVKTPLEMLALRYQQHLEKLESSSPPQECDVST
jgi:uncharacterized protein YceH (UPF0502 family)